MKRVAIALLFLIPSASYSQQQPGIPTWSAQPALIQPTTPWRNCPPRCTPGAPGTPSAVSGSVGGPVINGGTDVPPGSAGSGSAGGFTQSGQEAPVNPSEASPAKAMGGNPHSYERPPANVIGACFPIQGGWCFLTSDGYHGVSCNCGDGATGTPYIYAKYCSIPSGEACLLAQAQYQRTPCSCQIVKTGNILVGTAK